MYYHPIRHILRTSEQRILLGLSQANLVGLAAGFFLALLLWQRFPFLPTLPTFGLGLVAGAVVTCRWAGWPIYRHLAWATRYALRHLWRPQLYDLDTTSAYRPDPATGLLLLPWPEAAAPDARPTTPLEVAA
jgi:hypothetical protein